METIKYEAVFGDQSLFNGMLPDAQFVCEEYGYAISNGKLIYCERHNQRCGWSNSFKNLNDFIPIAMRRIIKTPVWTWDDKKAGRLPEVGCKCVGILNEAIKRVVHVNKHIVAVENEKTLNVCNFTHEEFFRNHKPIETPAEKAQRLEDEWVNKAWGETAVFAGVTQDEHDRLRIHLKHIYRAQLSGELKMPESTE